MGYSIGDKVRIIKSKIPERVGLVVTVVSDLTKHCSCGVTHPTWEAGYHVDLPNAHVGHTSCFAWYMPWALEPVYDGDEKSSWEALKDIYNPHKQKVV
jgi:hypothetical protein